MEQLSCKNCGAPLADSGPGEYKCPYCGSRYRREGGYRDIQLIEVHTRPAVVLGMACKVPFMAEQYRSKEEILKQVTAQMAQELATSIIENELVDIKTGEDVCNMVTEFRGSVRIIPPGYRF